MLKSLSPNEIRKIQIEVLHKFDLICKENNLKYTLAGGSLLGAVRHHGFIPWDDDIDVSMPRNDYNKLFEIYDNNSSNYKLVNIYNNNKYGFLLARLYDANTVVKEEIVNRGNVEFGVFIDIFPIDNLGNTFQEAIKNFNKNKFLKNVLIASNWSKYSFGKTKSIIYEPIRLFFYIISRFFNQNKLAKKIDSIIQNTKAGSNYKGVYCGLYKNKEIFEKYVYDDLTTMTFEDNEYSCISNYDKYLTQFYGKYMELPPLNKRVTHHTFNVYNIDK